MFVYVRRVMLSILFMVWVALWVEDQFVQAGPLAEAVAKAKAAAGVTDENAAPEQAVGNKGVQPALPPTAGSEPPQRVEVSTVSVAVRLSRTRLITNQSLSVGARGSGPRTSELSCTERGAISCSASSTPV